MHARRYSPPRRSTSAKSGRQEALPKMTFEDERLRSMNEHWPPRRRRKQTHPLILLAVTLFASSTLWLSHTSLNRSAEEPPQPAMPLPAALAEPVRTPDVMQPALSDAQPVQPPHSGSADCYRAYDRSDRADTFVRCGTAARSSCCRSFGATPCYYQVETERCDNRAIAGSIDTEVPTKAVNSDGDGDSEDDLDADNEVSAAEEAAMEGAAKSVAVSVAAASDPPPIHGPLPDDVAARAIVPMIVVESGTARSNTRPDFGPCASSGRAWRLWAAGRSQGEIPGHWAPSHRL